MADPQPSKVVEADFGTIKVQLAPGGTDAPKRPTKSTQLVWGGDGASTPWGLLKALIEASGGAVNYTYLHAAALVNARNAGSPDAAKPHTEGDDKPKDEPKPDPGTGPMFEDGLDFEFDNSGKKDARVWAHPAAHDSGPRPLVVFLHGILRPDDHPQLSSKLGNDWTTHAGKLAAKLIDAGKVTPLVIAAPTCRTDKCSGSLWQKFDLGKFVGKVVEQCKAQGVEIDLDQVSVSGHSGAGCDGGNGLYKVANEHATFDGHRLRMLGFADTCVSDGLMKIAAKGLKDNPTTVIYSVHKGRGGGSHGVSMDEWTRAMGASKKTKATAGAETFDEIDDLRVDDEESPKRIAIHLASGDPLWAHEREWVDASAMKSGWKHSGYGPHYIVCLIWFHYALQRFYPKTEQDHAQPPKPAPAPRIEGGEWADVPSPPPNWEPPDGAEPKATGQADFADPASAIYWPVRTRSEHGRTVCFEKAGGGVVGIPNGKGGMTTQGRHFLALRDEGTRYHVGVDLFGDPHDLVVAIESGTIINWHAFYHGVYKLFVQCDSGLVINYGEVDKGSAAEFKLAPGKRIVAGQPIARIGRMSGGGHMLHFEMYPNGTKDNDHYHPKDSPNQLRKFKNDAQYLIALARVGK